MEGKTKSEPQMHAVIDSHLSQRARCVGTLIVSGTRRNPRFENRQTWGVRLEETLQVSCAVNDAEKEYFLYIKPIEE